jgi:hypothetical protein
VGHLFGTFSDVGRLVMGRFESGTFCAVGSFESGTFQELVFLYMHRFETVINAVLIRTERPFGFR